MGHKHKWYLHLAAGHWWCECGEKIGMVERAEVAEAQLAAAEAERDNWKTEAMALRDAVDYHIKDAKRLRRANSELQAQLAVAEARIEADLIETDAVKWMQALHDRDRKIKRLREALEAMMNWIGPPPVDQYSYDSVRESAWKLAKAALAADEAVSFQHPDGCALDGCSCHEPEDEANEYNHDEYGKLQDKVWFGIDADEAGDE